MKCLWFDCKLYPTWYVSIDESDIILSLIWCLWIMYCIMLRFFFEFIIDKVGPRQHTSHGDCWHTYYHSEFPDWIDLVICVETSTGFIYFENFSFQFICTICSCKSLYILEVSFLYGRLQIKNKKCGDYRSFFKGWGEDLRQLLHLCVCLAILLQVVPRALEITTLSI